MSAGSFRDATIDAHDANLIVCVQLNESSGNRAEIAAGVPRYFTDANTVGSSSDAIFTRSADFEASNSERLTSAIEVSRNKTQISVSLWVKIESLGINGVFVWESTDATGKSRLMVQQKTSNQLVVGMRDTSAGSFLSGTSTDTFSTGTWYHILAVIDTTADTVKAWVNGVSWINASVAMGNFYDAAAHSQLMLGCNYDATDTPINFFDGLMDQVLIWDAALDSTDASALYNSGSGLSYVPHASERAALWSVRSSSQKRNYIGNKRVNPFMRSRIECNVFDAALDLEDFGPVVIEEPEVDRRHPSRIGVRTLNTRGLARSFKRHSQIRTSHRGAL